MTINWIGEALDTIFSLAGKYARFLNARGKRTCFLIWTVCVTFWMFRDIYLELYSQAFFCSWSVILNLYGYWNWGKKGFDK